MFVPYTFLHTCSTIFTKPTVFLSRQLNMIRLLVRPTTPHEAVKTLFDSTFSYCLMFLSHIGLKYY